MKKQYDYAGAVNRLIELKSKVAGIITYDNGDTINGRMSYDSRYKAIFLYAKGRKRYGNIIYSSDSFFADGQKSKNITTVIISEPNEKKEELLDWFQTFESKVSKICKYINKNLHPNLWQDIRQSAENVEKNLPNLKKWFYSIPNRELMEKNWGLYKDEYFEKVSSILETRDYFFLYPHKVKTMSVKSCGFDHYVINGLKRAIETKTKYYDSHRRNYDYSVSIEPGNDGILRGFLNAEFKNCGNGHYYLLMNENSSLHYEDD